MSLNKKENSESVNGIKSQKDIILEKIHRIKSYNNSIIKDYFPLKKNIIKNTNLISPFYSKSKNINFDSNQNSIYKKVFIKPLVKQNRIKIRQKYLTNNCTLTKHLDISKIQKLNKNNKIDINNNIINNNIINLENKTIINKGNSLNETTSDYEIDKIPKFQSIHNNKDNIIFKDNLNSLKKEKKNNLLLKLKHQNNHNKKNINKVNRICLKNNNNININILEKFHTTKGKDGIKINSINVITNNNIKNLNNPLYLSKIFSLSNTINESNTLSNINPEIMQTDSKIAKNKKMRNKIYLNNTNLDINKINEENQPNSNYYNSITEITPNSKIDEIEITGLNLNSYKNENKRKKINILETKKKIINSIEREKQKIINESVNNYRKYLFLIQKQQKEYEEYDQYLKNELNNNQNKKLKLQLFKNKLKLGITNKNNLSVIKNKKMKNCRKGIIPGIWENKTLSSKNFNSKKYRNKNIKIFALPNKNVKDEKKISATVGECTPFSKEENDSNFNYNFNTNNNEKSNQNINKKSLKLYIDDLKKYKKIVNIKNNYNKILNKNEKNKNIIFKKNISNLNDDYSLFDTFKKSKQKINTEILNNPLNNKKDIDLFNNNKNNLTLKNIKKNSLLKKLMKDMKIEKQNQKIKSKINNKTTVSNMNNNNDYKYKSLIKMENFKENYKQNILSNIPLENFKTIHRMITEEKNKTLNKLNLNSAKYKDKKCLDELYSQFKNKEIINKKHLNDENTSETYNKNKEIYSSY